MLNQRSLISIMRFNTSGAQHPTCGQNLEVHPDEKRHRLGMERNGMPKQWDYSVNGSRRRAILKHVSPKLAMHVPLSWQAVLIYLWVCHVICAFSVLTFLGGPTHDALHTKRTSTCGLSMFFFRPVRHVRGWTKLPTKTNLYNHLFVNLLEPRVDAY